MEYIRIKAVSEQDFDGVIVSVGGSRTTEQGSADYILNDAVIELKLIMEEGFEKEGRQRKLADLFRQTQPASPVVLVNPKRLNPEDLRAYYRIVEGPIKTACKTASKQLKLTAERLHSTAARVLVILNVGYTLLSPDEFKEVCLKCVLNDTSGIDCLICGGIYFYSDKWDNYVISRFDSLPINLQRRFPSQDALEEAWSTFLNNLMTDMMRNPTPIEKSRMPLIDLAFELNGIRYVKPAPKVPSNVWPDGGAPRENSSGIDSCPTVALTFPLLAECEWERFKKAMPASSRLKETYKDWVSSCPDEARESCDPLKPFVYVQVNFDEFTRWKKTPETQWHFSDIGKFSSEAFYQHGLSILEHAKDTKQSKIVPLEYMHVIVKEIGNDKANDCMSLYYVCTVPGFERKEPLITNIRLFWEYAMVVAATYAIKRKVDAVFYTRQRLWS